MKGSASDKKLSVADLSADQAAVYMTLWDWSLRPTVDLLRIGGTAGSGKSTLLGVFAKETKLKIAYATFTGKASSVLQRKLHATGVETTNLTQGRSRTPFTYGPHEPESKLPYCGTLHRLLYAAIIDDKTEQVLGYRTREELDREYDLVVLDEASMISDELLEDLKRHQVRILAVGDHAQLPPVGSTGSLMKDPDMRLEKIHRQAEGSPIIQLSRAIREEGRMPPKYADGERVIFDYRSKVEDVLSDIYGSTPALDVGLLCWTNKNRIFLNKLARKALGIAGAPRKDDILLALRNKPPVYNGMRGVLTQDGTQGFAPWHLEAPITFPDELLAPLPYRMCAAQFNREKTFKDLDELHDRGIHVDRMGEAGDFFDFGYALTVHRCVAPETLVQTPEGLERASDVAPEGLIATPDGHAAYKNKIINAPTRMLRIETTDGYSLGVTTPHGMDVWDRGQGYVRREARDLKIGDYLRLRLGYEFDRDDRRLVHEAASQDVRAKIYALPKTVTPLLAEFLGLMVADGTVFDAGFRFVKRHEDVADRFDFLCRELFGCAPKRKHVSGTMGGCYHVDVSSRHIVSWLRGIEGLEPNAKRVPSCVLRSSLASQAAFIRGLVEDGTVNIRESKTQGVIVDHIEFGSISSQVRDSLRVMLLRFGIVCGSTSTVAERVNIYGGYVKLFKEKIGWVSRFNRERLALPVASGTRYVFPLLASETGFARPHAVQRHKVVGDTRFDERRRFHHSAIRSITKYIGPSVCVEVSRGHRFLQNGFAGWNSQGSQYTHAVYFADMPETNPDWRRFAYTAVTRASERLTVLR